MTKTNETSQIRVQDLDQNLILAALPQQVAESLTPHLDSVVLGRHDVIYHPCDPLNYVYFPIEAVVSSLATAPDGKSVEVAMIGNEGMAGVDAIYGATRSVNCVVAVRPGRCLRIRAGILESKVQAHMVLQQRIFQYTGQLLVQISQVAACNRLHLLKQRLCRWLLMIHDRIGDRELSITHESLSRVLGVARSEISNAAGLLRSERLIDYRRGKMEIRNREGLHLSSCDCYQVVKGNFDAVPTRLQRTLPL